MVEPKGTSRADLSLLFLDAEKLADALLKEDILRLFLLYIPHLAESKILLFLFSICSNMVDYDTSNPS